MNIHNATFYAIPWDDDIAIARKLQFMNMNTRKYFQIPFGKFGTITNDHILNVNIFLKIKNVV